MPPKPKAQWTTNSKDVVARSNADGSFHAEVPLLDAGVKTMTIVLDVTSERGIRVLVKGEPNAELTNFEAWSDL